MRRGGLPSIGILGPVLVERDGRRLGPDDFETRKVKQVCEILLVHQGEAVPKDRIVELLWGREQPRDPMRTLEAYVSVLRRDLEPIQDRQLVMTARRAYRLDAEDRDGSTTSWELALAKSWFDRFVV